jgi:hypothetical protein
MSALLPPGGAIAANRVPLIFLAFVAHSFEEMKQEDIGEEQLCELAQFLRAFCDLARVLDNARILFFAYVELLSVLANNRAVV